MIGSIELKAARLEEENTLLRALLHDMQEEKGEVTYQVWRLRLETQYRVPHRGEVKTLAEARELADRCAEEYPECTTYIRRMISQDIPVEKAPPRSLGTGLPWERRIERLLTGRKTLSLKEMAEGINCSESEATYQIGCYMARFPKRLLVRPGSPNTAMSVTGQF